METAGRQCSKAHIKARDKVESEQWYPKNRLAINVTQPSTHQKCLATTEDEGAKEKT